MARRNKVELIGNLGTDPDVRYTANGNPVANLAVATDESYKDRNSGQRVQRTEWHRVVVFGHSAEFAAKYLKKGNQVFVEGKLQTRKWQDQSGQHRYTTEVVVEAYNGDLQSLEKRPSDQDSAQQSAQTGSAPASTSTHAPATEPPQDEWDIPF